MLKSPIFTLDDKLYCSVQGRLYEVLKGTDPGGRERFVAELPGGIIEIQPVVPESNRENSLDYQQTSYEANQIAHASKLIYDLLSIFEDDEPSPAIERVLETVHFITKTSIYGLHRLQTQVFEAEDELRTERLKFSQDSSNASTSVISTNFNAKDVHRRQDAAEELISAILHRYSKSSEINQRDWDNIIFESCFSGSMLVLKMVECNEVTFKDNFFFLSPEPFLHETEFSPLHVAAKNGHVHIVNWFLENRRSFFSKSTPNRSLTVAQVAVAAGQYNVVDLLARSDALPIVGDYDDPNQVLRTACISNRIGILDLLVDLGMKLELITHPSPSKITPAHDAVSYDHIDVLNWLYEHNFPWEHTFEGLTPLQYAVSLGRIPIVNWFYEKHLFTVDWTSGMNSRRQSLEHVASLKNQLDMLQWLLTLRKANKTPVPNDEEGFTLAHQAARSGSIPILNFLTLRAANCLNEKSFDGRTCAHVAADNGQVEVLRWLANHEIVGQNGLSVKSHNAYNCVHYAVQHALRENVQTVLYCLYELDAKMVREGLAQLKVSMPHLDRHYINHLQTWLRDVSNGSNPHTQTQDPPSVLSKSAQSSPALSLSGFSSPDLFARSASNNELGPAFPSPEQAERETSVSVQLSERYVPFSPNSPQRNVKSIMNSMEGYRLPERTLSVANHGISALNISGTPSTPSAPSRSSSIYEAPLGYPSIATTPVYASVSLDSVPFGSVSSSVASSSGNTLYLSASTGAGAIHGTQTETQTNWVGMLNELAAKNHLDLPIYNTDAVSQTATGPKIILTCKWQGLQYTAEATSKSAAKQRCAAAILSQYDQCNSK